MKILSRIWLLLAIAFISINVANAQSTRKDKDAARQAYIKKIVETPAFVFKATFVMPVHGASRALNADYDVVVTKDTVTAFLPYYGRAFISPMGDDTDGGIKFTNTNFSYTNKIGKKGDWKITITPKDKNIGNWRDVQYLVLDIFNDGNASLSVISTNRDAISFNGYVEARGK